MKKCYLFLFSFLVVMSSCHVVASEEEQDGGRSYWDTASAVIMNPYVVAISINILMRIANPIIGYAENGCYNLYENYWLTPEQREKRAQEKAIEKEKLNEQYDEAYKQHFVMMNKSEMGQKLLLMQEVQAHKINGHAVTENEIILAHKKRELAGQELAFIEGLLGKSDLDPRVKQELEQKRNDCIRKWMANT